MNVRVTSFSNGAGDPYRLRGAPDIVMVAGASGGAAALASLGANAMNAPAATAPAPPFKNTRRSSRPFPAASRASSRRRSWRRARIVVSSRWTRSAREVSRAAALLEVANRGGKAALPYFARAAWSGDPKTADDFGDALPLRLGLTLIWVGWQFDVPARDGGLRLDAPVATDGGRPIEGLVRC